MVNEDLITALKNAVDRGDSLKNAVNTMINSGYNPKEVEEASRFVGGGISPMQEMKPDEQLAMPQGKGIISTAPSQPPPSQPQQPAPQPQFPQQPQTPSQQISPQPQPSTQQPITPPPPQTVPVGGPLSPQRPREPLTKELSKIHPKKGNMRKEIILLIILLLLIGILVLTIVFREKILDFF